MNGGSSPAGLSARFALVAQRYLGDGAAERAERSRRKLLAAIADREPATLNEVAASLEKGAPAISRAVDALVRSGLVERRENPDNRRQLSLRLTEQGRADLDAASSAGGAIGERLERLAPSELRAIERAVEILERDL